MKNLRMDKILLSALYFTIITVTLIYLPTVYRQFDIGKAVPFKMMISFITILFCFWQLKSFKAEWWEKKVSLFIPFIVPIALLVFNYLFSTLMSDDIWMSLTGLYERQIGTSGFLTCLLVLFYIGLLSDEKTNYEFGLFVLKALTLFLGVTSIMQYFSIYSFGLSDPPAGRSNVFLGNANFLGDQIVFFTPLFLSSFLLAPDLKKKALQLFFFVLCSFGVLFTGTRGSYLALGASTLVFLFLILFIHDREEDKKLNFIILNTLWALFFFLLTSIVATHLLSVITVIFSLLFLGLLIKGYFYFSLKAAGRAWKKVLPLLLGIFVFCSLISFSGNSLRGESPILERYYSLFEIGGKTTPRYLIWKDSIAFFKDIPLWGVGPEMFREKFMSYKTKETEVLEPHTHYDNPHNNYLYILFSLGSLGLLFHLWILFRFLQMSFLVLGDKKQSQKNRIVGLGFFATMVSYVIWTIPGFEFLSSIATFWTFMGSFCLFNFSVGGKSDFFEIKFLKRFSNALNFFSLKAVRVSFFALMIVLSGMLIYQNFQIYSADKLFVDSLIKRGGGDFRASISSLDEALEFNPRETYYHLNIAKNYIELARKEYDLELRARYIEKAEKSLRNGLEHAWSPDLIYATWANARLTLGDRAGAIERMNKVLEVYPATIEYRKFLNYIEHDFGK